MQWLDNVQTQANMSMPARSTCHSTVLAGRPQLFLPNLSCRTRSSFRVAQAQKRVARRALTVPINALQAFACYPSPRVALQTQRWAGGITPNACCLTSGDSRNGQDTTAVIVVDHGSRREASNEMLFDFVRMYRQNSGRSIVEGAHMEIAKPSISDAMHKCVQAGANRIIIAPYFLSRGRHIQEDIPALVKEAQQQHEGLECIVAQPIGLDPLMAQLIEARVQNAQLQ